MNAERKNLDKTLIDEVLLNNSEEFNQKQYDKNLLYQDIMSYLPEMKEYVEGTLLASLSMEIDMDKPRERRNKALYEKLLLNPELKDRMVNELVKHGLKYTLLESYNQKLADGKMLFSDDPKTPNSRRTVFMRKFYSTLSLYQISLRAVYLDDKFEAEKLAAEQAKNRSR